MAFVIGQDPSTLTTSSPSLRVVADDQRQEFQDRALLHVLEVDPAQMFEECKQVSVLVLDDKQQRHGRSCAEEFEEFIRKFGKKYDSLEEKDGYCSNNPCRHITFLTESCEIQIVLQHACQERRAAIFCQNLEFIKQRNSISTRDLKQIWKERGMQMQCPRLLLI